tara:strand:+ start:327 stop:704 length:378 start_codon:yes stop_codon:yes gene_type:complete
MGSEAYKGSKAELLKKYGPKIKEIYGAEELNYIKEESSGPGGVDRLRNLLDSMDAKTLNRGGMVKKKKPMKASKGGTPMAMGKAKMAKKKMRGGGMMKKKMMGGGMAKMSRKKKMMRGGMAKKKK